MPREAAYPSPDTLSAMPVTPARRLPWEMSTPLGIPVEPLVYMMTARSAGRGRVGPRAAGETQGEGTNQHGAGGGEGERHRAYNRPRGISGEHRARSTEVCYLLCVRACVCVYRESLLNCPNAL